jgi:thioredoxin 1
VTRPRNTTDGRFAFDVLRAEGPVLVDFHADWCRPCQLLDPVLDELAEAWGGRVRIVKLDVEANPHTAAHYGVQSIPTLVLFEHGEERYRLVNVIRRHGIEDRLGNLVPGPPQPRGAQGWNDPANTRRTDARLLDR